EMSSSKDGMGQGLYTSYGDLIQFYQRKSKECPKGVRLKLQDKVLYFQFEFPGSGKRSSKASGCPFSEEGVIQAISKCWKIREALDNLKTASEFWEWYSDEILKINEIENDLKTDREIFQEIENEYWKGRNKNTKRKRSKDIPNDVATFKGYYKKVFERFQNWDKAPEWEEIKSVLFSWKEGSKTYKDAYIILRKVCNYSHNAKSLVSKITFFSLMLLIIIKPLYSAFFLVHLYYYFPFLFMCDS
ncbi:hypothetical protein LAY57_35440, partial [Argonema antarcticum A004/B2]|nr:hypothetical protein [Argonema antarcticum A004/B2]